MSAQRARAAPGAQASPEPAAPLPDDPKEACLPAEQPFLHPPRNDSDSLRQPLLPHPCCGERGGCADGPPVPAWQADVAAHSHACQHQHGTTYAQLHLRMAAWLLALFAGYAVQRGACQMGLPYDGIRQADAFELFSDACSLLLYGLALGWLVGVACPRRWAYLASRRRWYAWATFLGTPPVYSAISNVRVLKRDLANLGAWGLPFIVVWSLGMLAILAVIVWHLARVAATRRWQDAAAYTATRLAPLLFFGGGAVALRRAGVDMHLHHLYVGWSLALWGELDHPLSAITLAVGCGIFAQGIGAYSFAPVFQEACISPPTASALICDFQASSPFSLQICAAAGPLPSHRCTTS